jgi:hypothetical protein
MKKFIIYAPPYDENSGGSIALHKLCHLLNIIGRDAFIYPFLPSFELNVSTINDIEKYAAQLINQIKVSRDIKTNPNFKTPVIPPNLGDFASEDMVVIYPEITEGNPLKAKNVVRWLLHTPGFHTGNIFYGRNELYFFHGDNNRKNFNHPFSIISNTMLDILHIPTEQYTNKNHVDRQGVAYCLRKNKHPRLIHDLTNSICIGGMSHAEISQVFDNCKTFISYDPYTLYSTLAVISGCESIVAPQKNQKINDIYPDLTFMNGIAYGFDDLSRAKSTTSLLHERISKVEENNNRKIAEFLTDVDKFFC